MNSLSQHPVRFVDVCTAVHRLFFATAIWLSALLFVHSPVQPAHGQEATGQGEAAEKSSEAVTEPPAAEAAKTADTTEKPAEESKEEEKPAETEDAAEESESPPPPRSNDAETGRTKLNPDEGGRIQFNYIGQPWGEVLQDFADASGNSLDWQELPVDTLNLTTQRQYTVKEAHDLLNRHLLARGFTMLHEGEVLTIVKVGKLDPSLIPRTTPDELENFAPHDFMRVTFSIPLSMEPAKAAEDVKILLSPNAKVTPLLASKRLLVIDAVTNLRDVRSLLYSEQSAEDTAEKPREFLLKHRRADYVADQVMIVLGLDPQSRKTPDELKLETKRLEMQMKMLDKNKDISKLLKKDGPKVHIVVNRRRNSILVNAAPEFMTTIERTIKQIDVPDDRVPEGTMALTLHQYQLVSASPKEVISALENNVNLDPRSRLQGDAKNRTLLATATEADHDKIREIISELDATVLPTVDVDKLQDHEPSSFVRVRFQLPYSMDHSDIAAKVKQLLSSKGTVTVLQASRRLLVVDSVENLLEIREMLRAEELSLKSQEDVREFLVKHRMAQEMSQQILSMLDARPSTLSQPQGMRFDVQGTKLFMALDEKRNSLRIGTHPELVKMIEQILHQFDVDEVEGVADATNPQTMVLYKIVGQNVSSTIAMLRDLGGVAPTTRLQTGPTSQTLYAIATQEEHGKIRDFLESIAPNQIPRLEADQLDDAVANDLARVRFQLPLAADASVAATQIRGILGPQGKVQPLAISKQLIVVDTVANLREIRDILQSEEDALRAQDSIREFPLKHRRAEEMVEQVLTMLGLDPTTMRNPRELRTELQKLKIFITSNLQRNSLVVNARADKMAQVESIVQQLDVPKAGPDVANADGQTMVPYKVHDQNVSTVVQALTDIGNLDPLTQLKSDAKSNTLFAYASQKDHDKIRMFFDTIGPPRIHRAEVDQLEEYPGGAFLRVRFQLPMTADVADVASQINGLLGRDGELQSLASSKQLIVMDKASNLIEIREALRAEAAALESQNDIREFRLQHRRADEMLEQVLTMLGLDPATMRNPQELRRELQTLKLFITTNAQRNSLVVNAPADKMVTVEQVVKQLDVAEGEPVAVETTRQSMVTYKMNGQDFETAIKALKEIGQLEPRTRLQGDQASKTLYAYASKQDHNKIRQFIDDSDPNQVRRVDPDELEDHASHDTVRVRFQLPLTSNVHTAADQVEGILGKKARVQSLESSKQLVVVDTVANLIDVRDVLYAEQLAADAQKMPRVFPLQYRRATYVAEQVMILLGLDPSARKTTSEMQFETQRMQMMMQEAQQRGRDISKLGAPDVFIAVNRRQNSLMVNGPIEKMPLIERAIEQIDVPTGEERPLDTDPLTMEKYQTVTAGTEGVIRALEEIGNLDPKTQLESDAEGKTIYALATPTDHVTIKKMIDKLDGTGRRTEVRWLPRHLPADQVAGSIMALIVGPEKKEKKNRRPWYYYSYRNEEEDEKGSEGFRVLPDVDNNRLLLWANDVELEEVDNMITKLSDISNSFFADHRKVRRLEARDPETTQKLLEQLKKSWSGDNKLEIELSPPAATPKAEEEPAEKEKPKEDKVTWNGNDILQRLLWLAQVVAESNEKKPTPPIKITVNDQGEIIITSEDTAALDELEGLIEHLAPAQREFISFQLHYIHVLDVVYNLENYFKDALDDDDGESFLDWFGRKRDTKPDPAPITLGKRTPLRFIDDVATNTLIVANASARQLSVIQEMIDLYDQPPNPDLYLHRKTEAIKIKYSQASDIANSLKDVYRDLLSTKDKEFQDKEGKQSLGALGSDKPYVFGNARRTVKGSEGPVLVRFSGALSIGVDELSNSLIVSARKEVLEEVKKTIMVLDKAAKPETVVRVHLANGILNADDLQGIITQALANPWIGGQPGSQKPSRRRENSRPNNNQRSQNAK